MNSSRQTEARSPIPLNAGTPVFAPRVAPDATEATPEAGGSSRAMLLKATLRAALPLRVRKAAARALGRQRWLSARHWWIHELLQDYAATDPNGYHRFLWEHHLCYADTYEVGLRFGSDRIHPSRRLLFEDLSPCLESMGVSAGAIRSVFEVGSSLGYNLRHLETEHFSHAEVLEGCDIDSYAVARGNEHLRSCGSKVRLFRADMAALDTRLHGRTFDVTLCAGVLMYLTTDEAREVVASLLRHTNRVVAFAGLADPDRDNATLSASGIREEDRSFIHNIDQMVVDAGGRVLQRRWEGARMLSGNTLYFVFASPAAF